MKRKDPDGMENALNDIDRQISPENIPPTDKNAIARARAMLDKLRNKKSIHSSLMYVGRLVQPVFEPLYTKLFKMHQCKTRHQLLRKIRK